MSSISHKKFRFFKINLIFMRIFEEKVNRKSYQIEIYSKKSENFTMGVHCCDKHHGVNSSTVYIYHLNIEDIKISAKVQIPIKY